MVCACTEMTACSNAPCTKDRFLALAHEFVKLKKRSSQKLDRKNFWHVLDSRKAEI